MKAKRINPAAVVALREALTLIYWYKRDLRAFLTSTLSNPSILSKLNWEDYKRNIVGRLVDFLARKEDLYQEDLLTLMSAVSTINDFNHLERLEDGQEKADRTRAAVRSLRRHTAGHELLFIERQKTEERRKASAEKLKKTTALQEELEELKRDYWQLVVSSERQLRGYRLEKILAKLFELFDLDPKASFRIEGEQIDGAFTFDGIDYLFEAKWQEEQVRTADLDSLSGRVMRKLDNTLGLFLSINGFSPSAVNIRSSGRSVLLLMDGSDLMTVLEGRIDLKDLLLRKRRHAAQTGDIYLRVQDML